MANTTIQPDEQGAYELHINAGDTLTVKVLGAAPTLYPRTQVLVHDSTLPVYARRGTKVQPRDPKAAIIATGTWAEITTGPSRTLALTCESDATISVAKI